MASATTNANDRLVVVIAGASSGVGRACAERFADAGASLVLAARRAGLLDEVVRECEARGAQAIAVPTDVGDSAAVAALAEAAVRRFGRIDVWLNNAAVGAVGAFDETPAAAHERIVRTNLVGPINGAHAAVPLFKRQGRGVLINTNSLGAWAPAPYAVAYGASKAGLRGFSEALRGELSGARFRHIHVCDVYPTFLDTPGIAHGANYTGREMKPAPLVKDPYAVADTIVALARRPRPTTIVGLPSRLARMAHAVSPGLMGWGAARFIEGYLKVARPAPRSDGAVFAPQASGRGVEGGWRRPQLRALAAAGAGLAIVALFAAGRRRAA